MLFARQKDWPKSTTMRKVYTDDKKQIIGIVGTVADLLDFGLLEYCDYSPDDWCFTPYLSGAAYFSDTRQHAIDLWLYRDQDLLEDIDFQVESDTNM